jgi:Ca-activated chloride channel family protein
MTRRLALLIILPIAFAAHAQVTLDQVQSGTLLLKTSKPGVYIEAPAVDTDVKLRVRGMILRGEVTQRFRNPEQTCAEAVYAFPLPEDAAVDTLRMTVGQHVIEGEIKERKEAEQIYQQAKSEGKHASLLSQERPNIFTVSIATIAGGEEVTVAIEYQQSVDYKDGAFRLRFPMTVAPRYMPASAPMMSSAIPTSTVGTIVNPSEKHRVHLSVDLDSGFSLRRVDSSYQQVTTAALGGSHYMVTLADAAADRDFELVWQPDLGSEPKSALFMEKDYALLMIMPPATSRGARLPKESIFIIDTSGSMEGSSIVAAKSALQLALDHLDSQDTFNIIEFNSVTNPLWTDARPATSGNLVEAKRFVDGLKATGGTEMMPALDAAFRDGTPNENAVRQVIFMTDGQVGNESQLFSFIRSHLGRSRLFTVGIGTAPNTHFMRDAARFGRGTFTYIGNRDEVQTKMSALFEKLESPVLTNVEFRFDDPAVEMWPQRIPDLYAGEPVVVAVRFSKPASRVIASAKRGTEEWNDVHSMQITSEESGVGRLWARRKIEALSDSETDVRPQIVQLALAHHLVSQYTSLVAVDHTPTGVAPESCQSRPVPVNLPAGWGGVDGSLPGTASPAPLHMLIGIVLLAIAAAIATRR